MSGDRRERALIRVMLAGVAVVGLLNVALVLRPDPFDPLRFEPQRVEILGDDGLVRIPSIAGFDGFDGPAIRVGDRIPVRAEFVVQSDKPIEVVGTSIIWETVDPKGIRCANDIDRIPNTLDPGPHVARFANSSNECVREVVEELGALQWNIRGEVEVLTNDGESAAWATEPFWYVP